MQGARRAHIRWPIFNRRATRQDGMRRFPNTDVFLGQDTNVTHAMRSSLIFLGVLFTLCAFFWPLLDDLYGGIQDTDDWAVLSRAMRVDGLSSALAFVLRFHAGYFVPVYYSLYLFGYMALGAWLYPAMKVAGFAGHSLNVMSLAFLSRRNLGHPAAGWMAAALFGTCYGMFGLLRYPFGLDKVLGLGMVAGALVSAEHYRTSRRGRWLAISVLACALAPATSALGIVAAPLSFVYAVLVMRVRGKKLLVVATLYALALCSYAIPYLAIHGRTMSRYLARDPRGPGDTFVTMSPVPLLRWMWAVVVSFPVKERYLTIYNQPHPSGWLQHVPGVAFGATVAAGLAGVAAGSKGACRSRLAGVVRYAAFCAVGVLAMIAVVGIPRFSLVRTVGQFFERHRWQSMSLFFFTAFTGSLGAPGLCVVRKGLGRCAPWVVAGLLTAPVLCANRLALGAYERARERNDPMPAIEALIRDVRHVQRLAAAGALRREETFLPECLLPTRTSGARHRMSLEDLDRFLRGSKHGHIQWVKRLKTPQLTNVEAVLSEAPALRELYETCYPGLTHPRSGADQALPEPREEATGPPAPAGSG
jgi:hypothetical protein